MFETPLKLPPITCWRLGGTFKSKLLLAAGRAFLGLTFVRPDKALSISEREGAADLANFFESLGDFFLLRFLERDESAIALKCAVKFFVEQAA